MALNWQLEFEQGWPDVPVCGVDEAGRGPWAGPVTAAAIVLPAGFDLGVDDSKKLTEKTRERLFDDLLRLPHGIGFASVEEIDEMNILQATFLAMRRAVEAIGKGGKVGGVGGWRVEVRSQASGSVGVTRVCV